LWLACAVLLQVSQAVSDAAPLDGIRLRDPLVLAVPGEQRYYLYGTCPGRKPPGFDAYMSTDLRVWEGPFPVFEAPAVFWADRQFWAPEVHAYKGRYFLLASFAREYPVRGTQVCVSDSPRGPFVPIGNGPQTPHDWQCLDGTLFIDDEARPWMVFCHEWTQVGDGEICAVRLAEDLSAPVGEPLLLFRASQAAWVAEVTHDRFTGRVTDGPWLHRTASGALLMLWSSFDREHRYCIAVAHSESGRIEGPWRHEPAPWFQADGGHAMLFRGLDGQLRVVFHQPNRRPERPRILTVREEGGRLIIADTQTE